MKHKNMLGWDIGGAHLKAALINEAGELVTVYQHPCPLWQGLEQLQRAAKNILQQIDSPCHRHAITMTGELVDLFADRDDGVQHIVATMNELLAGQSCLVFAGINGFIAIDQITPAHYLAIASANWLASATYAAQQIGSGLFVDIGSTTTDILLLQHHTVQAQGYTDYQRLVSKEDRKSTRLNSSH